MGKAVNCILYSVGGTSYMGIGEDLYSKEEIEG